MTRKSKLTHAPTEPSEDKKLTAWLQEQAKKLKDLTVKGERLKLDFVANAREKGRILLGVRKRLESTPHRFQDWVAQSTDIGYSTALLWIDVAQNFAKVKARFADSNPLELTVRQVRDAIRDERQAQGTGKPRSGKQKGARVPKKSHPFEGENVPQVVHQNSLSWVLRERWARTKADPEFKPPQLSEEDFKAAHWCFQEAKKPGSTYATVAQATGKDEAEVKRLLSALDIDKVDAIWANLRRQAEDNPPEVAQETQDDQQRDTTIFHHGCKDFKIEDGRTLTFTNQRGDKVVVVSVKKGIERLLVKAVTSYTGKGGEQ